MFYTRLYLIEKSILLNDEIFHEIIKIWVLEDDGDHPHKVIEFNDFQFKMRKTKKKKRLM